MIEDPIVAEIHQIREEVCGNSTTIWTQCSETFRKSSRDREGRMFPSRRNAPSAARQFCRPRRFKSPPALARSQVSGWLQMAESVSLCWRVMGRRQCYPPRDGTQQWPVAIRRKEDHRGTCRPRQARDWRAAASPPPSVRSSLALDASDLPLASVCLSRGPCARNQLYSSFGLSKRWASNSKGNSTSSTDTSRTVLPACDDTMRVGSITPSKLLQPRSLAWKRLNLALLACGLRIHKTSRGPVTPRSTSHWSSSSRPHPFRLGALVPHFQISDCQYTI